MLLFAESDYGVASTECSIYSGRQEAGSQQVGSQKAGSKEYSNTLHGDVGLRPFLHLGRGGSPNVVSGLPEFGYRPAALPKS